VDYAGWVDAQAAGLLLDLEPPCPISCEDALRMIAENWQISDKLVPFYLVTQFGKLYLTKAVSSVAVEFKGDRRHRVETVAYWAGIPSVGTIDAYIIQSRHRLHEAARHFREADK
jgi:hypothetical protein